MKKKRKWKPRAFTPRQIALMKREHRREWLTRVQQLIDDVRRSEQITGDDLKIIVR